MGNICKYAMEGTRVYLSLGASYGQAQITFRNISGAPLNIPPEEITERAKAYAPWVNDHIWDLNRMQKEKEEPAQECGDQCTCPYECWYYAYCRGENPRPEQLSMDGIG